MEEGRIEDTSEDFIVHKAGPPLPLRRPKKKPMKAGTDYENPTEYDYFHHHFLSTRHGQLTNASKTYTLDKSDVKCERVAPANQILRTPSRIPTPTLRSPRQSEVETPPITPRPRSRSKSLSVRSRSRSRPSTPSLLNVESKVKLYIEQVKKYDDEQRNKASLGKERCLSLEEIYQIQTPREDHIGMEERLKETLRLIKEKDDIIEGLRESCHNLKLKWADAENRIDEMRFGLIDIQEARQALEGRQSQQRRFSFSISPAPSTLPPPRSLSSLTLNPVCKSTSTETPLKIDKATETGLTENMKVRKVRRLKSDKSRSEITTDADEDPCDFEESPESSQFDQVIEEKCSNWLEKVQNWKTVGDSNNTNASFEVKDKDSCGGDHDRDRDSGFKGSTDLDLAALQKSKSKLTLMKNKPKEESSTYTNNPVMNGPGGDVGRNSPIQEVLTPSTDLRISISIPTMAAHFSQRQEEEASKCVHLVQCGGHGERSHPHQHPPASAVLQPWCRSFSGNVNPLSTTEYEGFPSFSSSRTSKHGHDRDIANCWGWGGCNFQRGKSASMGRLNLLNDYAHSHNQRRSSEHRDLFKMIDKRFKILHPLIDDATYMALRAKRKQNKIITAKSSSKETDKREESRNSKTANV